MRPLSLLEGTLIGLALSILMILGATYSDGSQAGTCSEATTWPTDTKY